MTYVGLGRNRGKFLHLGADGAATVVEVPCGIFPADAGLIVADAFGASIVNEAPEHRLPAATRKAVMLRFAHAAALRLQALNDPQGPYSGETF